MNAPADESAALLEDEAPRFAVVQADPRSATGYVRLEEDRTEEEAEYAASAYMRLLPGARHAFALPMHEASQHPLPTK